MELSRIDRTAWNALLGRFPARTVFHRLEWLELLEEHLGGTLELFGGSESGELVAVWPVITLRRGPLRIAGSPLPGWSSAYMGPLGVDADHAARLVCGAGRGPLRGASYSEIRAVDHDTEVDLGRCGYGRLERFETYLLDLPGDHEALWNGVTSKCRNAVRKGRKNGFEVRREAGDDFVADFWRMSCEVFGRWGLAPGYDEPFLRRLVRHLEPAGLVEVRSAVLEGRRAATIVVLRDDRTAYYWAGGSFEEFRRSSPNNLLLWECLVAADEAGLGRFDFVSSSGSAGRFKASFGPRAVEIATHWGRSRTRIEGWLKDRYAAMLRRRRERAH